ncbi:MAG: radical SAM protein, partial [Planctomycetota bacterium]
PSWANHRELGMKLQDVSFHNDSHRHETSHLMQENAVHNYDEMLEGKEILDSYPSTLGIDLFGKCNIKPPCVYCMWDESKELEGDLVDAVVDADVLEGYGPFFRNARHLVNCSIGEPLMHPGLKGVLESFDRNNKLVEIATNGQVLSKKQIDALVGKRICLYVSLDAATKKTYSILRNDKWDSVVEHLHELNRVRKQHGNLPRILMVFMPMRANMHEVEDYFRLCRDTEADSLVLRPLNYYDSPGVVIERAGYVFDYKKELLTRPEIDAIIEKCMELSIKYNVPISNQFAYS